MLYIVTPLSRVENLENIVKSFPNICTRKNKHYQWYCVVDGKLDMKETGLLNKIQDLYRNFSTLLPQISNSFVGHSHRNYFLNEMIAAKAQWQQWIPEFTNFQNYEGNSHDNNLIATVLDNNIYNDIDMLHIDGDHTYEGVKADFENFKSLVKKGGMIVFHDIAGIPDVAKFWNEVKAHYPETFREIIHEGGWGIGMIIV